MCGGVCRERWCTMPCGFILLGRRCRAHTLPCRKLLPRWSCGPHGVHVCRRPILPCGIIHERQLRGLSHGVLLRRPDNRTAAMQSRVLWVRSGGGDGDVQRCLLVRRSVLLPRGVHIQRGCRGACGCAVVSLVCCVCMCYYGREKCVCAWCVCVCVCVRVCVLCVCAGACVCVWAGVDVNARTCTPAVHVWHVLRRVVRLGRHVPGGDVLRHNRLLHVRVHRAVRNGRVLVSGGQHIGGGAGLRCGVLRGGRGPNGAVHRQSMRRAVRRRILLPRGLRDCVRLAVPSRQVLPLGLWRGVVVLVYSGQLLPRCVYVVHDRRYVPGMPRWILLRRRDGGTGRVQHAWEVVPAGVHDERRW